MKYIFLSLILFLFLHNGLKAGVAPNNFGVGTRFYPADDARFRFTGRVDFSNPRQPRFWASGVYIQARYKGSSCSVILNDEILYGTSHNYVEILVDHEPPLRIQTKSKTDTILVGTNLPYGEHDLLICKDTESGIGWLSFSGLVCPELLVLPEKPNRRIECIGNSITCGAGSDLAAIPCGRGTWYDQHNAYLSYGAIAARTLNAQWQLSSVSGIGLVHSCCDMNITMPQVFDKVNMRADSLIWNFTGYMPDVVTICLGQNDGIQDSVLFCGAYVKFIRRIRSYYPKTKIVCITSPMADDRLTTVLKNYLESVGRFLNESGDREVHYFFFSKRFHNGCGGHPDLKEHRQIAAELSAYLRQLMNWN